MGGGLAIQESRVVLVWRLDWLVWSFKDPNDRDHSRTISTLDHSRPLGPFCRRSKHEQRTGFLRRLNYPVFQPPVTDVARHAGELTCQGLKMRNQRFGQF